MFNSSWLAVIFSFIWPGLIVAALTAAVALVRRKWGWLVVSSVCAMPFLFYLGMTPRFYWAPYLLLLHAFACIHMRRGNLKTAAVALIPTLALVLYVLALVVTQ